MKLYIDDSLNRWQKSKLMNKLVGKGLTSTDGQMVKV